MTCSGSYANLCQWWSVTTEGDEEGRSIRQLGVHYGFVDEIATLLAPHSFYGLRFAVAKKPEAVGRKVRQVDVSFDIESQTWNMGSTERATYVKELFRGRDVKIKESNYYASFVIEYPWSDTEIKESSEKFRKEKLLSAMSAEDRALFK
jgi:hypothetical protein